MTSKTNRISLHSDITTDVSIQFHTPDGFIFSLVSQGEQWTDNDMTFDADPETKWPIDANGQRLQGYVRRHYFQSDRTMIHHDDGTREVIQHYGDGESWAKTVIMPRSLVNAWIRNMREEGYQRRYLNVVGAALEMGYVHSAGDGGPGRSFVREPRSQKPAIGKREFCIITQTGGLDI